MTTNDNNAAAVSSVVTVDPFSPQSAMGTNVEGDVEREALTTTAWRSFRPQPKIAERGKKRYRRGQRFGKES